MLSPATPRRWPASSTTCSRLRAVRRLRPQEPAPGGPAPCALIHYAGWIAKRWSDLAFRRPLAGSTPCATGGTRSRPCANRSRRWTNHRWCSSSGRGGLEARNADPRSPPPAVTAVPRRPRRQRSQPVTSSSGSRPPRRPAAGQGALAVGACIQSMKLSPAGSCRVSRTARMAPVPGPPAPGCAQSAASRPVEVAQPRSAGPAARRLHPAAQRPETRRAKSPARHRGTGLALAHEPAGLAPKSPAPAARPPPLCVAGDLRQRQHPPERQRRQHHQPVNAAQDVQVAGQAHRPLLRSTGFRAARRRFGQATHRARPVNRGDEQQHPAHPPAGALPGRRERVMQVA